MNVIDSCADSMEIPRFPSFFRHAKRMALTSSHGYRLGACVVKSGRVLSVGKNEVNKTNWLARRFFPEYPTIHAEVSALSTLSLDAIRGSVIYVHRERRDGKSGLAMPCRRCRAMLVALQVKRVIYSMDIYPYFAVWVPA